MAIIFDGRAYARKKEDELYHKILKLKVSPVMASILVGEDPASKLYVRLKKEAAARVGAQMDIYEFPADISPESLVREINRLNRDKTIKGIMIQLPLPGELEPKTAHIISHITPSKDVDGLREASPFMPATVRAVVSILGEAGKSVKISPDAAVTVVGARGEVGSKLVDVLTKTGYEVVGLIRGLPDHEFKKETLSAKVLISATGSPEIITKDHVSKGAVVIDVGSPKGDVTHDVHEVAGFVTPVPGGVGPVTVVSLLENLVEASEK